MARELDPKGIEKLEAKHQIQFRFAVPNAHFSTGLVERRMRMVHDFMGKLNMQGNGMSVSDISLVPVYCMQDKYNSVWSKEYKHIF